MNQSHIRSLKSLNKSWCSQLNFYHKSPKGCIDTSIGDSNDIFGRGNPLSIQPTMPTNYEVKDF